MKDITLNNGRVMSDAEFVKELGCGDTLTEFVATKADLESLASKLVLEVLAAEFLHRLSYSWKYEWDVNYVLARFVRVLDFLPKESVDRLVASLHYGRKRFDALLNAFNALKLGSGSLDLEVFVRLGFFDPELLRDTLDAFKCRKL